jgi:hypothetical protein
VCLYLSHTFLDYIFCYSYGCSSEALNYAGVFDGISQDSKAAINKVKNSALKSVNNARKTLRRRLAPKGIKNTIQAALTTEKLATCGVAAGAFLGLMA